MFYGQTRFPGGDSVQLTSIYVKQILVRKDKILTLKR